MSDAARLFVPPADGAGEEAVVAAAIACIDAFTDCFNDGDLAGMDALLHFPHVILSGETFVVWEGPGRLSAAFFEELRATGWRRSTYHGKGVVLVSPNKVHLLVDYSRDRGDGGEISRHRNLWIVTCEGGRWGIKVRSY